MKYKGDMELDTTIDAVVDVVGDAVVEEHTLAVDVDTDVTSNAEGINTAKRTGTAPIPVQSVKLPAQSTKMQQHLSQLL